MAGTHSPQDPELAGIGIEPQLIPSIIAVESGERRANDSNPLLAEDAQTIADILDEAVSAKPESKGRWIDILCKLSRSHGVRPKSCSPSGVTLSGEKPYKAVGSVEVWKGKQGENQVCVKAFQLLGPGADGTKQEFYREIVRWKYISHSNVLPFLGVLEGLPGLAKFCIVSPWLENGNIFDHVNKNPDANRFELLAQAARGLNHLHSLDIEHGSIHPGNILINSENDVCLVDFGIAVIMTSSAATRSTTGLKPGCARYMAPELLSLGLGKEYRVSKESDVYSLAMTAFQVLSGVLPYDGVLKEAPMTLEIIRGVRPPRPTTDRWLPDPIWQAIQQCWQPAPESRLPIGSLRQIFASSRPEQPSDNSDPPSPPIQPSSPPIQPSSSPIQPSSPPIQPSSPPIQSSYPPNRDGTSERTGFLKRVKNLCCSCW